MRFISPSFNQQGWTSSFDLNAVAHDTSPAFVLRAAPVRHAVRDYLSELVKDARLDEATDRGGSIERWRVF